MDRKNNNKYRNMDVSEEEFRTLQELEKNDDGFFKDENSKLKKAGCPIAPLGGGNALYFDYSDEMPVFEDVIAIQFQTAGKIYWYYYPEQKEPGNELRQGDIIVAYSERGMELAKVLNKSRDDFLKQNKINFIKNGFVRKATKEDFEQEKRLQVSAEKAKEVILRLNKELNLKMKVVKVKYTLDDTKVIFYFSSNGRVDFRELIKKLAFELRKRIEMHQIGVRDTTKILGGLGPCGQPLCCCKHMHSFSPVSIKMARDQNLSLNPNKISGTCGRLFCCLSYEDSTYESLRKDYPLEETPIFDKTSGRQGYVKKVNVINKTISVFFPENQAKKEKAEEKIFLRECLEKSENSWAIFQQSVEENKNDQSMFVPVTPKEKEVLLENRDKKTQNNSERRLTRPKIDKTEQQNRQQKNEANSDSCNKSENQNKKRHFNNRFQHKRNTRMNMQKPDDKKENE